MSATDVLTAVRNSSPAVKAEVLAEMLREAFVGTGGGPVPVPDGIGGVLGYVLKAPPAGPYDPPELTPEEWGEIRSRVEDGDVGIPLDQFMVLVDREIEKRVAESAPSAAAK